MEDEDIFKEEISKSQFLPGNGYDTGSTYRAYPYSSIKVESLYQSFKKRYKKEESEEMARLVKGLNTKVTIAEL